MALQEIICGVMDVEPARMNQLNRSDAGLKMCVLLVIFCLLFPVISFAQDDGEETVKGQGPETSSPYTIRSRSQFACAEVKEIKSGGLASHEITVSPKRVERCVLQKVGTRFHECLKLLSFLFSGLCHCVHRTCGYDAAAVADGQPRMKGAA